MGRIGKHQPGNSPDGEEKGSFLSVSATGHVTDETLRIEGFSSMKRGQDHRVLKVQCMYNFKPET